MGALAQGLMQWAALLGCAFLVGYDSGWHTGAAVGLAIYALMPVAE